MAKERIVYQNWIVSLGRDPSLPADNTVGETASYNEEILSAVQVALAALTSEEESFIRAFYFQGWGYRQISGQTGRELYKLEALHQRAVDKLKTHLSVLLDGKYGLAERRPRTCPLCQHERRAEIDRVLASKKEWETWGRCLSILREQYGIPVRTPQLLIGHCKYHMVGRQNGND